MLMRQNIMTKNTALRLINFQDQRMKSMKRKKCIIRTKIGKLIEPNCM